MLKIVSVIGARPQFIKAAVISRAIQKCNEKRNVIQEIIIHSGQHYDDNMSQIFFSEMRIPYPDYHLGIGGGTHGAMTGRMLEKVEEIVMKEKPDCVLVYGDTNSTLAGALAAAKLNIRIAHVEAGLRSYNTHMPEEINRVLTDRISHWLFCPTDAAVRNLAKEGFNEQSCGHHSHNPQIYNVGDVMYDAVLYYKTIAVPSEQLTNRLEQYPQGYYLATIHRAENTDNPSRLESIITALEQIAAKVPIILPVHPRTRAYLRSSGMRVKHITMIEPVGYFDMLKLLEGCKAVFTDSGGLQKEAYFFRKPCITLREETEWGELVQHGFNRLVGANYQEIIVAEKDIEQPASWELTEPLYGHGNAGEQIVNILVGN